MNSITSSNREITKIFLRENKNFFSDNFLSCTFSDIQGLTLNHNSSIVQGTDSVKLISFNVGEEVDLDPYVDNGDKLYFPGLPGDTVSVGIGTTNYDLSFNTDDVSITYNSVSYGLNDILTLGDKDFTIFAVGGAGLNVTPTPTYSITESSTSVNEGSSVSFTVNTTDVGAGTTLYFNATGGQVDAADFSDGSLSGNFQIIGTGTTTGVATFVRSIATDFNTENETFSMQIRTGSLTGPVVATSNVITIGDVVATFSVAESATTVNEGGSVLFTLFGNNIPAGTYYYTIYEIEGVVAAADFSPAATSGFFTVSGNQGNLTLTLTEDRTTEGVDKFKVQFRRDSTSGTIIAESNTITIGDVSRSVGENATGLTFGPVQVNRDDGVVADATDWYAICDLDNVPDGSSIALFIDGSGSMTQATVKASYDLLVSKLSARGITITTVTNSNEDWITPFLVNLP